MINYAVMERSIPSKEKWRNQIGYTERSISYLDSNSVCIALLLCYYYVSFSFFLPLKVVLDAAGACHDISPI